MTRREWFGGFMAAANVAVPAARPTEAKLLLAGNWADPSILKDGGDYYMTHSSFEYHPGLLVWHSKDLRRWKPIARAVVNQKGSIWAPDIIKHQGRYYLYYPAAGENWVVTAERMEGPWTPAQAIGAKFIDPGHVVDVGSGKRYVHLSGGHVVEMSADGLRAVSSPRRIYEGWPIPQDWTIECFCLESPKLLYRDGWYHMMAAQGGTLGPSTSHMATSARSRTPVGPWENSPHNPIIRTWSRQEEWWSKGHGTLVEGPGGQWYCVLHGVKNGLRTMGRPTLIEPVEWTRDGWYRVPQRWPSGWDKPVVAEMPMNDDFTSGRLGIQWQFHGLMEESRLSLGERGVLSLAGYGGDAGSSRPLALMPMDWSYEVEVDVEATGGVSAGLLLFAGVKDYIGIALQRDGQMRRVQDGPYRRYRGTDEPSIGGGRATLRIVNMRQDVRFYYRGPAGEWKILQPSAEVSGGGALRVALCAYGAGVARFRNFRYRGLENG